MKVNASFRRLMDFLEFSRNLSCYRLLIENGKSYFNSNSFQIASNTNTETVIKFIE